ncbi:MAG: hypothetical protein QM800_03445 [Paludibacter sp.]
MNNQELKQFLVAIVRDEINQPGNFESSRKHLQAYCENEGFDFVVLCSNLRLFFGLLDDYKHSKDPVLYHFLRMQACNCFLDEAMFVLLPIEIPQQINTDLFCEPTSATNFGMVGAHLIGM